MYGDTLHPLHTALSAEKTQKVLYSHNCPRLLLAKFDFRTWRTSSAWMCSANLSNISCSLYFVCFVTLSISQSKRKRNVLQDPRYFRANIIIAVKLLHNFGDQIFQSLINPQFNI